MSKVLTAYGTTGKISIHEPGADLDNPLNNLGNIYFHSDLDYLSINSIISGTLNLPTRTYSNSDASSAYGSTIYNIYSHGLGYSPLVFATRADSLQPIAGDTLIQEGGTCNLRSLLVGADNTNIYIRELYLNKDTTFPSLSLPYNIYIFNESVGV